jgi:hypothetical protein
MGKIITKQGQSLFDIALQAYGSIEGVFGLLADNPTKLTAITDFPTPGTELKVTGAALNKFVVAEYSDYNIVPATAALASEIAGTGIGYWAIGDDFIVTAPVFELS